MTSTIRGYEKNKIKVILFPNQKIIRKITGEKNLKKYIKNEFNGLNWYRKRLKLKKTNLIKHYHNQNINAYIDIKLFYGKKNIFYRSIIANEKILMKAIDHYIKIWGRSKNKFCHGDLTVDNVMYSNNKIRFIDWELSGLSNEPWGFDLVYLIISSLFFPFNNDSNIKMEEKIVFKKLWSKLKYLKISQTLLQDPISFFLKTYKKKKWKQATKDHPKKFFPHFANQKFKNILKELIK